LVYKLLSCIFSNQEYAGASVMNHTMTSKNRFVKILIVLILLVIVVCAEMAYGGETRSSVISYTVQVASFKNIDNARKLCNRLNAHAGNAYFKAVNVSKTGTWYAVFTGRFETRRDAVAHGRRAKQKGLVSQFEIRQVRQAEMLHAATETVVKKNNVRMAVSKNTNAAKQQIQPQKVHPGRQGKTISSAPEKTIAVLDARSPKTHLQDQTLPALGSHNEETAKSGSMASKKQSHGCVPIVSETSEHEVAASAMIPGGHPLYNEALSDFHAERYSEALLKFKDVLAQDSITPAQHHGAARFLAHCYYFLGKEGMQHQLFKAVDQYKHILRQKTGAGKDDDLVLFRLADSYRRMQLNYEALATLKTLETSWPDSHYRPDSLIMMGEILYRMRKYTDAIEKFRKYIACYRNEKSARAAYFHLGNCYSLLGDFGSADRWYGEALEKWPLMEELSKDELMKLGSHYLRSKQYERANEAFFTYVNLYIDDPDRARILYSLARSFIESGRQATGLTVLSHIMQRYPESVQARNSAAAMAEVGISSPDMGVPELILCGIDNYRNPIATYDAMLKDNIDATMKEQLLFQKGDALLKRKKYKEAFETFRVLVRRYPFGKYRNPGRKDLVRSGSRLVEGFFAQGDYLAVSDIYFKTKKAGLFEYGNFDTLYRIGQSLNNLGLSDAAAAVVKEMRDVFKNSRKDMKLLMAMADVNYERGHYEDAKIQAQTCVRNSKDLHGEMRGRALRLLADINYRERHFKEAAGFYVKALSSGTPLEEREKVYKRYADSLKSLGYNSSALVNYEKAIKACSDADDSHHARIRRASYEGLAECFYRMGKYDQSVSMYEKVVSYSSKDDRNLWTLYHLGLGYLKLNKDVQAEQVFTQLQEGGQDAFWETLVAYSMNGQNRADSYERYTIY